MNKRNFFKSLLAAPAALVLKPEVSLSKENIPPVLEKPKLAKSPYKSKFYTEYCSGYCLGVAIDGPEGVINAGDLVSINNEGFIYAPK